jgi:hypothetical protein
MIGANKEPSLTGLVGERPRERFNICLPRPEGYQHSFCLLELSELLTFSLQDLDYEATFRINHIDPGARNIIVGCHLFPPSTTDQVPASTIVVNSEQIYDKDPFGWNGNIFAWVRKFETWDYSSRNVAAFGRLGLPGVKLLEIGHQPQLNRIPKVGQPRYRRVVLRFHHRPASGGLRPDRRSRPQPGDPVRCLQRRA